MDINAMESGLDNTLAKLKDTLSSGHGCSVSLNITVGTEQDAKKVRAFAGMSGCSSSIDKKENHYIIHITGTSCCG